MVTNIDAGGYNFRFSERQWLDYARFVDFLYEQQRVFTDDLVVPVILRAIGQSQIVHNRGVNASSLAEALDLPRETVRRKCLAMVEQGWLVRDGDAFGLGLKVGAEIFTLVEDNIARLMATAQKLDDEEGGGGEDNR